MEKNMSMMSASQVVEAGIKALLKGKRSHVPGYKNYIQTHILRFMPRSIAIKLVSNALHPRTKREINRT